MGIDLDRLERFARGLAVLFYALLFLAFITAVMGSGGGGLLLLVLGAAAHVGRVGLEDFVERRRELGDIGAPAEGDAGERATGLRLSWMPRELHLPSKLRMPRGIDLGGLRARAAELRASLAALVAEVSEGSAGAPQRSFDPPHGNEEGASGVDLYDGGFDEDLDFADAADNFAVTDSRYEDFEVAEDEYEDEGECEDFAVAEIGYEADVEPEPGFGPELVADSDPEPPAARRRREPAPRSDAPNAQERYEARQRARAERGESEPIVAAVEAAETQRPQRVERRQPGARPDPLRTRRPTRSF